VVWGVDVRREKAMFSRWSKIFLIIVLSALIAWLNTMLVHDHITHSVLEELYYIPLLLGALMFGLRGALLTYLLVSLLYLFHVVTNLEVTSLGWMDRIQHLLFSGVFTFLAGYLVDHEEKLRKELEKAQYLAGIGKIATTITHDLKNPLITILGFARRIKEKKGNMDSAIQTIMDSAENMQRIVDETLDFAKPARLAFKEEDLQITVCRACQTCLIKAQGKNIKLMPHMPADPVNVTVDAFQLERALVNIICNAIDASAPDQDIDISLSHGRNHTAIRIQDHGAGMDRETIENIFIPFYSNKSNGTGLGIPIAKKIIEGHEGTLTIESHPGRGTEVLIKIAIQTKQSLIRLGQHWEE